MQSLIIWVVCLYLIIGMLLIVGAANCGDQGIEKFARHPRFQFYVMTRWPYYVLVNIWTAIRGCLVNKKKGK